MNASQKIVVLTVSLWLTALPSGWAQPVTAQKKGTDLQVRVRTFVSGDALIGAWPESSGRELAQVLPEVVDCHSSTRFDGDASNTVLCLKALHRDGLALEGVVDLAPIARNLDASTGIELWLDCPRLGFESSSLAMTDKGQGGARLIRSIRFEAGSAPPTIHIRFGYRHSQLAGVYLPVIALALALTLIAVIMARAGLAALSRTAVVLSTVIWMGAAAQLDVDSPLRILLSGTPFANLALLFMRFWPPLFCVAIGVALGSKMRPGQAKDVKAGEVLGNLIFIPMLLTFAAGILLSIGRGDVMGAAIWLAAAPIILLLRRFWRRASGRIKVSRIKSGELFERVSELAAQAACPQVKVYISFSNRSGILNAYAWPRKGIIFTAPLVRSLNKREVDAIAAHELWHFRHSHSQRGIWTVLCLAVVLFETPVTDQLLLWPGGLFAAILLPIAVFLASLHRARKREFAADAGAVALTGDAGAMISSLASITRNNNRPFDMNPVAECLSTHPSIPKRIRALAAMGKLETAEAESLCISDDQGDFYEFPPEENSGAVLASGWSGILAQTRLMGRQIRKRVRNFMREE